MSLAILVIEHLNGAFFARRASGRAARWNG